MKSVHQLLTENQSLQGHLLIRVHEDSQVHIQGSPEGFRLLAALLEAQANRLGNVAQGCTTTLHKGDERTGFMLSPDSVAYVHLHCHDHFISTQPGKETDLA